MPTECGLLSFDPNTCDDLRWTSGLKRRVYLARRADISSYTLDTDGNVTAIAFAATKGFVRLYGGREGNGGEQELQRGPNKFMKQSLTLKVVQHHSDAVKSLDRLLGADDLVAVVETQNQTFRLYFMENGAEPASLKQSDGTAPGEDAAYTLILEGAEKWLVPNVFVTSYADTLDLLESYVA